MDKNYYKVNDGMLWEAPDDENDVIWRYKGNPLFDFNKEKRFWHICNSAVAIVGGKYIGVFRCETPDGRPYLYIGKSADGVKWDIDDKAIKFVWKDTGEEFEFDHCYDPRLIKVEDKYFMVFCGHEDSPSIYIATTEDFEKFVLYPRCFLPCNRNGVLFPEKFDGKYYMLNRPFSGNGSKDGEIWLSESADLEFWGHHRKVINKFDNGKNYWERIKIGPGPAPIKTDEGWLLIYHGVQSTCNGLCYSMGACLLDLKDPSKVLYKAKRYLISPSEPYECVGFTPNVMFPCAALVDSKGHITVYYGAADVNMGVCFTTVDKLLKFVKEYD